MLVKTYKGECVYLAEMLWSTPGSKGLLLSFIRSNIPSWCLAINHLSEMNQLDLLPHGYLGKGSRGYVVKVRKRLAENYIYGALKVVIGQDHVEELKYEYETISEISKRNENLPVVSIWTDFGVKVIDNVNDSIISPVRAAGYVMSSVGSPAPYSTKEEKLAIFGSLNQLHLENIFHGDPRRQNVIIVDGRVLWIDFMNSYSTFSKSRIIEDAEKLLRSLHGMSKDNQFSVQLEEQLQQYHDLQDKETLLKAILDCF